MKTLFLMVFGCIGLLSCLAQTAAFPLVENGEPAVTVVRCTEVAPAIEFFQSEAAKCLDGKRFAEADAPSAVGRNIVFDIRKPRREKEDVYAITFPDERTMMVSCTVESARYAVAYVLHEAFGVRWPFAAPKEFFGEELNEYPPAKDVALACKPHRQGPMSYWLKREVGWREMEFKRDCWENKGHGLVHGLMVDVIPIYKYAEKGNFPEVYASVQSRGGKRVLPPRAKGPLSKNVYVAMDGYSGEWNPCFSDPAAIPVAVADVLERLEQNPEQKLVNIEIGDNGHMCQCERCLAAIGDKRNSMGFSDYGRVYWPFVSKVAAAVKAKRPDVVFSALSYREVNDPPEEPLPDNVIVRLCFEQTAMVDPEVAAIRRKVLADWSAKCSLIEFYDYNHGNDVYFLPRVYFSLHSALLREFNEKNHACGYYSEMGASLPFEGPKAYVLSKVLTDVTADPQALVREWCVDAVGAAAAEPLGAYWKFWEDYSTGERIRRTSWFRDSRFSIYQMFGQASPAYGLVRGDMARQRVRMEEVVAKAVTPSQKKRAAALMDMHVLAEDAATAVFAEYLEPNGTVSSAAAAAELLDALPEAVAAARRRSESKYVKFNFCSVDQALRTGLGAVSPFVGDAQVKNRLRKYAEDASLPSDIRGLLRVWSGQTGVNLVTNGSFETAEPMPACWRGGRALGRRTEKLANDGRFAFGGNNPMMEYKVTIEPGKTYILLFDVYAAAGSSEGRLNYVLSPYAGGTPRTHLHYSGITLPAGRWQTLTGVIRGGSRANGVSDSEMYVNIYCKKYEKDEHVYFDNVRIYCVDL